MRNTVYKTLGCVLLAGTLSACGEQATLPVSAGMGPDPTLPEPNPTFMPTMNFIEAVGWPEDGKPVAADGLQVNAFAKDLVHPRWLYELPNGDVLAAESDAPEGNGDDGIRGWIMKKVMRITGASHPSADRVSLLRDTNNDGVADFRSAFLTAEQGMRSPIGMTLIGDQLYIANTDAVLRFTYTDGSTEITAAGEKVADLPANPPNGHWTKNIIASEDGSKLYASVGSNSNVAENGFEAEKDRAAILEIDLGSGSSRVFASGLRNPVGLAWEPETGQLWTAVNERDTIGSDLVPDYMTSVVDGGFYGWPYSYFGQIVDVRVEPPQPELVAKAIKPDYALGAHTASLGLAFNTGSLLPERYAGGVFVGQHGSWNREPRSGYKVLFVAFENGKPTGEPEDILTGFVSPEDTAWGRPAGVIIDSKGALLVADDAGSTVWRVTPAS